MPTRQTEILTLPLPAEGLSAAQYRELEQTLKAWEEEIRANAARFPAKSYELGVQQTLSFLRMLGLLGQHDLPPAGAVGPTKRAAVEWQKRYTLHELDGALDRYLDEIRSACLYGLRGAVNPTEVASWLYKATRDAGVNWRMIARTEMVRANAAGRLDSITAMGYDQVWAPKHTGACSHCRKLLEDRVFTIDEVKDATNYGRTVKEWVACIPLHPHCFVPETEVLGNHHAVLGRPYQGEVVRVDAASGGGFTCTPNHPVLTGRGWVLAEDLREGDDLIRCTDSQRALDRNPDDDRRPAAIGDLAESLPVVAGPMPVAPEDFHGDGRGSEVYVVRADRELWDDYLSSFLQPAAQNALAVADAEGQLLGATGGRAPLLERHALSAASGVGALDPSGTGARLDGGRSQALDHRSAGHAKPVGDHLGAQSLSVEGRANLGRDLGAARGGVLAGSPDPQSGGNDLLADARGPYPVDPGDLLDRLTGVVERDQVIAVERFAWSGHVFNLETADGWYLANNYVTGNCRHVWLPYIPDVYEEAQADYQALAENGLDDKTLNEMFDSSGHLKPQYENDPRLLAYFEETGKTADPLTAVLQGVIEKRRREEPPGLHHTSAARNCAGCRFYERPECHRYNWQVDRDEVCASWEAAGTVGKGFFDNPQAGLDPLLWTREERLRADVRDRIVTWWRHILTDDAPMWSHLYIVGSSTSRAWGGRKKPGDVDVHIVVDYDALRKHHREYASLSDPELHAALLTTVKAGKEGVEVAPGLGLDAYIRSEVSNAAFRAFVSGQGQGVWDINRARWVVAPPAEPVAETYVGGEVLEGEGGKLAAEHPEWLSQARELRDALTRALGNPAEPKSPQTMRELREVYDYLYQLREQSFHGGGGANGLGDFIWRYLMDFGPLLQVKHLLHEELLSKTLPAYRWSQDETVAKAAKGAAATDAGVEHWITVHPHGPGTEGQPVLVRNSPDGKSMVVIGGAGGHLNYLRIDRSRQIKPTDGSKAPEQGPTNEPSDDSFENKTPEQLAQEEHEAQQRMEQARAQLEQLRGHRQEVQGQINDYVKGIVDQYGRTSEGEQIGWDQLTAEEQKSLYQRLKASALHVAVAGPIGKKDVNESGITIKRDTDPKDPAGATTEQALKDEQSDELADTPEHDDTDAPASARRLPLIALSTEQADEMNRLLAEQSILNKKARVARKVAAGDQSASDAMALDYTADDVARAVKSRVSNEARTRIARNLLQTAESTSKKGFDRASRQGGYDTLDTFAQAVLGDSQIKPEVARLLGVAGTAQLIAHKLYSEAKAGRLDIDKAYDALSTLTEEREAEVASRARARALTATEQIKEAYEARQQSGKSTDSLGLWTQTAANSIAQHKLAEAGKTLGMAITGLEAASAMKVALQRVVGEKGTKLKGADTKIKLRRGGVDQIRIGGFAGAYPIKQLAAKAGMEVSDRDIRRVGNGNYELTVDPRKLEHLFAPRQDPHKALRDQLEGIRTASDMDEAVKANQTTPGMTDVLEPAQAKGKMFLLAAQHGLLAFEPGVGKTHTALAAAMQKMHDEPGKHRVMIVAPKSVSPEWIQTIQRQGGNFSAQVLGSKFDEATGQQKSTGRNKQLEEPCDFNIVSYETLRSDPSIAEKLGATIHITDETQKAKNESSGIHQALVKASHRPEVAHRWALTGTALEKHTGDIHSALSWADPHGLDDQKTFREKFDTTGQYEHVTAEDRIRQFREGISERMFHLAAKDAGGNLPPRNASNGGEMHIVPVELSQAHRELLRQKVQEVNETNADLRRRRAAGETDSKGRLIRPSLPFGGRDIIMGNLHKPQGVAVEDHAIAQKVAEIAEQNEGFHYDGSQTMGQHAGHYAGKTVVFAEQVGHLAIVRKALEARGIKVFEAHASKPTDGSSDRSLSDADNTNNIQEFLKHPDKCVLLSSDKNNAGVNMQLGMAKGRFQHGATRLVHLTLPMNNARIAQRDARINRKGSVAPTDHYHVTANTPFEKLDRDRLGQERRRMDLVGNREDSVRTIEGGQTRTLRQRYTEQGGRLANEQPRPQEDQDEPEQSAA